jgi:2TM domain-containing protein
MTTTESGTPGENLRDRALKRLKKRRDLGAHALVYVLVNLFIVVIWLVADRGGFFWPIFPMGGWGIGLAMNAYDVFRSETFAEEQVQLEIKRLDRR